MNRPGTWSAVLLTAGAAGAACALALGSVPGAAAGVAVAGFAAASLNGVRNRTPEQRHLAHLVAELFAATRRLPRDRVIEDPETGYGIAADRQRGFLTLSVADPYDPGNPGQIREALVSTYMLGILGSPIRPPLYRHTMPLALDPPPLNWKQARQVVRLGVQTGADDVSIHELEGLIVIVARAIAAEQTPQ